MSTTETTVAACPECKSGQIQISGTNVRSRSNRGTHHRCRQCGHRFSDPIERPVRQSTPEKPTAGFARKVWELAEENESGGSN